MNVPLPISRRQLLAASSAAGLGLDLCGLLHARDSAIVRRPSAIDSCIFVFQYGGPSHIDTFDMKPAAPAEIRGEFQSIASEVPGLPVCEHLPHLAHVMNRIAVVRSMHHQNRLHDSASTETFTGRQGPQGDREEFKPISQFFPCHGAVVSQQRPQRAGDLKHVVLPWRFHNVIDVPCQAGGFLGPAFEPIEIGVDTVKCTYHCHSLQAQQDLSLQRIDHRLRLLDQLEDLTTSQVRPYAALYEKAYSLLASDTVQKALRIEEEPEHVRRRYGLRSPSGGSQSGPYGLAADQSHRGQNLLMARRLVEAGVPFINVTDFRQQGQNWDAHANNFGQHKDRLLPAMDISVSALIEDLDQRGLLDRTLVVVTGEFGRTPRINKNAGRDHWPDCYSLLLAGGGVTGGVVHGASDSSGAYPERDPVTPADLAATIYERFGLDWRAEIHDPTGRPYRLSNGKPIQAVLNQARHS